MGGGIFCIYLFIYFLYIVGFFLGFYIYCRICGVLK